MHRIVIVSLLLLAGLGSAGEPGEEEAYTKLRRAREQSLRARAPELLAPAARRFLAAYPGSTRAGQVRLWLGDALAATQPREAYAAYAASSVRDAAARATRLAALHEAPPAVAAEYWVGTALDPRRPHDKVTALVFLAVTHPQTAKALPHLIRAQELQEPRGFRLAAVAAVIDDHKNQRPKQLRERVVRHDLPFPVAIDKQRGRRPSVTFEAYLGSSLPWVVLIDRYGRVAWMGSLHPTANAATGFRAKLAGLLAEPTYATLMDRVLKGDMAALDKLGTIRTPATVTCLLTVMQNAPAPKLRKAVQRALRGMAPSHYSVDPNGLARWRQEKSLYRYSLAEDRLVKRKR